MPGFGLAAKSDLTWQLIMLALVCDFQLAAFQDL